MKILPKYITRNALVTLLMTVGVFTFVLLLARTLKDLSEMLVNRRVGLDVVVSFIVLTLPTLLAFSLPMAILATALLVMGRLSADNEITAMRASGIGVGAVVSPLILLGAALTVVCAYMNLQLAPQCRFAFKTLLMRVGVERPMALLEEGAFMKDFPGCVLYVGRKYVDHAGRNVIEDVIVYSLDERGEAVSSLRAKRGFVTTKPEERKLVLDLYDVRGDLRDASDPTNPHKIRPGTTAQRYPLELDVGQALKRAATTKKLGDLAYAELLDEIQRLRGQKIYPAAALMEAHQRWAMAAACVSFVLIGIPLGMKTSRRETSVGIAISLVLALCFYFFVVLGSSLKNKPFVFPEAVLWSPNLAFQLIGLWLLRRVTRV